MSAHLTWFLSRYDRRSLVAWGILGAVYLAVFLKWTWLVDLTRETDFLLGGIWAFMTLVLAWDIAPARDTRLVVVAFFGGLVIEWWGTTTGIWHYWTAERPPGWILPAWPVAALAIDRIARMGERLPRGIWVERAAWLGVPVFVVAMAGFASNTFHIPSTRVILGLMLGVLLTVRNMRHDVLVFYGGALLGVFLEYWGTSRHCWTYFTGETPPLVAAVAHGFASLAFSRGEAALAWLGRR